MSSDSAGVIFEALEIGDGSEIFSRRSWCRLGAGDSGDLEIGGGELGRFE